MPSQDYLSALDLINQQGASNIAAMQQGQQMRLSDLQYKQLQDQVGREKTLRDIMQTAVQGAMTQPQPLPDVIGMNSYKPEIANGIWGGSNAVNPQEAAQVQAKTQDIQNKWDNRANVQTMTPGGFDANKYFNNMIGTGNPEAMMKGLEGLKALKGEITKYAPGETGVDISGKVVYQGGPKQYEPTKIAQLLAEKAALPPNDPRHKMYDDAITKESQTAAQIVPRIIMPSAPTMSEIIDPTNPKQLIRVDARIYKGGGIGAPGVLGISGKEPGAAKIADQVDAGRGTLDTLVTQLKNYYDQLNESGGITSTKNLPGTNLGAWTASSAIGQTTGKMFGTDNQSIRNQIVQQRPLLLQAIKQATGMSAKQMDSNVEMKMYLSAATDPNLNYEANISALNMLNKLYGIGKTNTEQLQQPPVSVVNPKGRKPLSSFGG